MTRWFFASQSKPFPDPIRRRNDVGHAVHALVTESMMTDVVLNEHGDLVPIHSAGGRRAVLRNLAAIAAIDTDIDRALLLGNAELGVSGLLLDSKGNPRPGLDGLRDSGHARHSWETPAWVARPFLNPPAAVRFGGDDR